MEGDDWELLAHSDSDSSSNSVSQLGNFNDIEADTEGIIRSDYFSLENDGKYMKSVADDVIEDDSIESDNPSWIDPATDTVYRRKSGGSCDMWSDSGSDRVGIVEGERIDVGFEGIGGIEEAKEARVDKFDPLQAKFSSFEGKGLLGSEESVKTHVGIDGKDKDPIKFWSGSIGDDAVASGDVGEVDEGSEVSHELLDTNEPVEDNSSVVAREGRNLGDEGEKGKVTWWKVPFEVLRYCVFRISPVWTFSMAAAVVGFVILGRRLYKMKHKAKSLKLNVTVDDKKVSQVMGRAARLNEAFSVVRRVPIVRPVLLPAGVNTWPAISLR